MRPSRIVLAIVLVMLAFSARVSAQAPESSRFVTGEILVKFSPGVSANAKADAHRLAGGTLRNEIARTGLQLVAVQGDLPGALARYRRNPNVLYAEPNFIRSIPTPSFHTPGAEVMPGDHYFHEQWALHNIGQQFYCIAWIFGDLCFYVGTADADIDGPEAWAISTGSPAVTVAVIDSGIDYTHPDLAANYAGGRNFMIAGGSPMDDHGHGTHVAGTIAAVLDNLTGDPAAAEGVVGVAPSARVLAYKVCSADGTCSDFAINQALAQAITDGAKVINMSLGGTEYSQAMNDAIQDAWNAGLVIVAAAGNNGTTVPFYPAALDHVISVGAFDEDHRRASFSNFGSWVAISAPGNAIMSTYPLAACVVADVPGDTGCYTWLSGTSMAAPHVSGAAALVWSRSDVTTNRQVVDILLNSADPRGVDAVRLDSWTVHGGLNLHDALSYASANLPPVADAGPDQIVTDSDGGGAEVVRLDGSASSDADGSVVSYEWREGSDLLGVGAAPDVLLSVGPHTLTLVVTDNRGASNTDSVVIRVNPMNRAPVANAGADQTVTDNDGDGAEVVTLNGSASLDPDGTIASYAWREGGTLVGVGATPGVSLAVGNHTLTLEVTDNGGATGTDSVAVLVKPMNHPPASANTSASTVIGTPVTVTLTGTDLESCELAFSIVQGPAAGTLGAVQDQACLTGSPNSDTARLTYTPAATAGTYTFTYKVSDGSADSNAATVTITVSAPPPPPPAALKVTTITPNVVSQNAGIITFIVTGTGFADGALVAFENGSGPAPRVISVARNSSTQLTLSVEMRSGGPRKNRLWDVRVTNPGGSTSVGAQLLTITP